MASYRRIKAVAISYDILLLLSMRKGPVDVEEISRETKIPVGTVLCHLATGEDYGFVAKVEDGYELGPQNCRMWTAFRSRLKDKIEGLQEQYRQSEVVE